MVQSKARRRSSLIWGSLLAILLGVAAAFFVLAMPISLLETITTTTRLSKLMVQAEPPISPNDRTLLAVLAGILVSAVGWVMLDWLLFGKAGLSVIMPGREDDFEDEDDDAFRPTDPLDLIGHSGSPLARNDWAPGNIASDPRRPLSARTDIGDPPPGGAPFLPGVGDAFPPAGQILPGAGVSAPPLPPVLGASPLPPLQPPSAPSWAADPLPAGRGSWPPLDETVLPETLIAPAAPVAPSIPTPPAARAAPEVPPGMPSWLPAPGPRVDEGLSSADPAIEDGILSPPGLPVSATAETSEPASDPLAGRLAPVAVPDILAAFSPASPVAPEMPPVETAAPQVEPPFELNVTAPEIAQPVEQPRPVSTIAPSLSPQEATRPASAPPPPEWPASTASPLATPVASNRPVSARAGSAGLDRARLEDLLERLERSLEGRRAAAARAPAQPIPMVVPAPAPQPAPTPQPSVPVPPAFAAPVAPVVPDPAGAPIAPMFGTVPDPRFPADPVPSPLIAPIVFSAPEPPMPVAANPAPAARAQASGNAPANDALLEQPLHMTLEQLRQMIRR
ncbi:hypothetical protein [Rhizorhabdus sp. FW153]|uniref:hypothetical protein n=1 Tax=Rhizorhabdus sp. FW153 TaxID=3400216 RepID=UPI003CECC18B